MEDQHESALAFTATGHRDSVIILFQVLFQFIFKSYWSPNHLETSNGSDHDEPQNFLSLKCDQVRSTKPLLHVPCPHGSLISHNLMSEQISLSS